MEIKEILHKSQSKRSFRVHLKFTVKRADDIIYLIFDAYR